MYIILDENKQVLAKIEASDYEEAVSELAILLDRGELDIDRVDSIFVECGGNM